MIEEFRLDDAANNPQRSWELWDLMLYDKVVSEPLGGAHRDHQAIFQTLRRALQEALAQAQDKPIEALLEARFAKLMGYGKFKEVAER